MKNCFLLIILISASLFYGCQENPVELSRDGATLVADTLYATFDSTYARDSVIVSTWSSSRLLLGHSENIDFRMALRFNTFPPNVNVQEAWIEFNDLDSVDNPLIPNFTVTGYPVDSSWSTDVDPIWGDDFRNNVNFGQPLGEMEVKFDTTALIDRFVFNATGLEFVNRWVDTTFVDTFVIDTTSGDTLVQVANAGLLLDFDSGMLGNGINSLKSYEARISGTEAGPRLFLRYQVDGETVTDTSFAANDIYFFEGDFEPVGDRTHTSTLIPWVSLYDFDVDSLKRKYGSQFIVSSANLQLPIDNDNSELSSTFGPGLRMMPYTFSDEEGAGPNDVVVNTAVLSVLQDVALTAVTDDSRFVETFDGSDRGDLALRYVQVQLNDPDEIKGYYVEHALLNAYVGNFAFFTNTSAPDPQQRPRLIIESLLLPNERF